MESVELIVYQIRGYNLIDFWLALLYCVGIGICISSLLYFHPNWIRLMLLVLIWFLIVEVRNGGHFMILIHLMVVVAEDYEDQWPSLYQRKPLVSN